MPTAPSRICKQESSRIRIAIRRVLLEIWDPIGVHDAPGAQDEYDWYLGKVFDLLTAGAEDVEIVRYLNWVSRVRMGMRDGSPDVMTRTMAALRAIPLTHLPLEE